MVLTPFLPKSSFLRLCETLMICCYDLFFEINSNSFIFKLWNNQQRNPSAPQYEIIIRPESEPLLANEDSMLDGFSLLLHKTSLPLLNCHNFFKIFHRHFTDVGSALVKQAVVPPWHVVVQHRHAQTQVVGHFPCVFKHSNLTLALETERFSSRMVQI